MVLVDSCVVIEFSRTGNAALREAFEDHDAAIAGIVRAELLGGARNPQDRTKIAAALDAFRQIDFPRELWDAVGDNLAELRRRGVTVPFKDMALATLAVHVGFPLWTRDQHFSRIQSALPGLALFAEQRP